MTRLSRRDFVVTAIGAGTVPFGLRKGSRLAAAVTAQEIIDRIKKSVGVEWKSDTVDTFKAGDPAGVVKGVVTTAMATMDVLRRGVKAGANLIITCEPTFYGRTDTAAADPVSSLKNDY